MDHWIRRLPPWARLTAFGVCSIPGLEAQPAELTTVVTDRNGQAVEEVVVFALAADADLRGPISGEREPLVMDQRFEKFVPHILIAQTGSAISFPNGDTVAHHVYSFSDSKRFELPLYQGSPHPPVTFDQPGVVDVGCNIHDHMEAHIVVVDTPYFSATRADGRAEISGLPNGDYTVQIYSPRLRAADHPTPLDITVSGDSNTLLNIRLDSRLRPPHFVESESLNWSRY